MKDTIARQLLDCGCDINTLVKTSDTQQVTADGGSHSVRSAHLWQEIRQV